MLPMEEKFDIEIPLYYISLCNRIYLEGKITLLPNAEMNLKKCQDIIDLWSKLGYVVDQPIDFMKYRELCSVYQDNGIEDLLGANIQMLKSRGYDELEIRLCYAICCYNKEEIKRLFVKNINPDVWIHYECKPDECNESNGLNALATIRDGLQDPDIIYGLNLFYEDRKLETLPYPYFYMFKALFQGAAYQEISNLIVKYYKKNTIKPHDYMTL